MTANELSGLFFISLLVCVSMLRFGQSVLRFVKLEKIIFSLPSRYRLSSWRTSLIFPVSLSALSLAFFSFENSFHQFMSFSSALLALFSALGIYAEGRLFVTEQGVYPSLHPKMRFLAWTTLVDYMEREQPHGISWTLFFLDHSRQPGAHTSRIDFSFSGAHKNKLQGKLKTQMGERFTVSSPSDGEKQLNSGEFSA